MGKILAVSEFTGIIWLSVVVKMHKSENGEFGKMRFFKKFQKMAPILTVLLPPLCYNVPTQFSQE